MIDNGDWWNFYDCDEDGQPRPGRYEIEASQRGGFGQQKVLAWAESFVQAMDTTERLMSQGLPVVRVVDITNQSLMPGMRPLGRVDVSDEIRQAVAERAQRAA